MKGKTGKGSNLKGARPPGKSVMNTSIGDSTGKNTGKWSQVAPSKSKGKKS